MMVIEMVEKKEYKTIEIEADTASLVRLYCVYHGLKMKDFVSELLEKELKPFKEKIEVMGEIKED